MQLLWTMMNSLQIIVHLPLVYTKFPVNAKTFTKIFLTLAQFDVVPHTMINPFVFEFKQEGLLQEERFATCGYETYNFILNSGSVFWLFVLFPFMCAVYAIFSRLFPKLKSKSIWIPLTKMLFFSFILRLWIESYFELMISSMINLKQL